MIFRILRHAAWPALLAAAFAPACSSKAPPADAFALTTLQPGGAGHCSIGSQTTLIEVGVPVGTKPDTVQNGGSQAGGQVSVSCTVHPDSGGFDIDLSVELVGQGAMHVYSTASGAVTTSGAMGISATFSKSVGSAGQSFTASDCSITYTYDHNPINPNITPIDAGRIWGHVSCVDAQANSDVILPDGGTAPQTCDAEADFLFENCSD
jgi:hypothetical protein